MEYTPNSWFLVVSGPKPLERLVDLPISAVHHHLLGRVTVYWLGQARTKGVHSVQPHPLHSPFTLEFHDSGMRDSSDAITSALVNISAFLLASFGGLSQDSLFPDKT